MSCIVTVRKIENFTYFVHWFIIKILKDQVSKIQLIQKQFLCHRLNQCQTDKNMFQAFWQLAVLMAIKRQNGQENAYPVQFVLDPLLNGQEFTKR